MIMTKKKSKQKINFSTFHIITTVLTLLIIGSIIFLSQYNPGPSKPAPQVTFEQKMAHLETGAPLPKQDVKQDIPRWMVMLILGFISLQIVPLVLASHKARAKEFSPRDLRQIEFLAETPLFLGLLGSLLGVCMTQFLNGSLSAPLAYLTTISGILLFLTGRFTILVSLPIQNNND
jgi:hypothetical protein